MITETRQSRTRVLYYEHHRPQRRHRRRRHHTLDNATLDQFNFICIPLHRDESRLDSSSSHSNFNMSKQIYSTMPMTFLANNSKSTTRTRTATAPAVPSSRRVRFNFDDHHPHVSQIAIECNGNGHSRSTDDIRQSVHRVQVNIPIHRGINSWLNVESSTAASSPAKTRYLTSKRIEMNRSHQNLSRLQGIAPMIEAELHPNGPSIMVNSNESNPTQWYRHMYRQLHKPPENPSDIQQNPYQPTYTFPEDFHGDPDTMEDYIRQRANQTQGYYSHQPAPSSWIRASTLPQKDDRASGRRNNGVIQKVLRFDEPLSSPSVLSPSSDKFKSNEHVGMKFSTSTNPTSHSSDTEQQKSSYRHVSQAEEYPSNGGVQRFSSNKTASCPRISFDR